MLFLIQSIVFAVMIVAGIYFAARYATRHAAKHVANDTAQLTARHAAKSISDAALAIYSNQERLKEEKEKIKSVKYLLAVVYDGITNLSNIKGNYQDQLTADPHKRVKNIPYISHFKSKIKFDIQELYFLLSDEYTSTKNNKKWEQFSQVRTMVSDYNTLINLWSLRNKSYQDFFIPFSKNITGVEILTGDSSGDYVRLIDLTELVITYTDDLLNNMIDFLVRFPELASGFIDNFALEKYGNFIPVTPDFSGQEEFNIEKSMEVDYEMLSLILKQNVGEIKKRY